MNENEKPTNTGHRPAVRNPGQPNIGHDDHHGHDGHGGQWGLAIIIRGALATAALGLALLMRPSRRLWFASIALGLLILASFAWTGHGAASEGPWAWVHLLSDIVHAVAAGVWIGALICFFMLLFIPSEPQGANLTLHSALHGFSGIGSLVVSALVITGVVNTMFIVGPTQIPALIGSSYGWVCE